MGKKQKKAGGCDAPASAVVCSACHKELPRSAFPKNEFSKSGGRKNATPRCRECAQRILCHGCNLWLRPALFHGSEIERGEPRCLRCRENTEIDRLLQTPKDEVTHYGAWKASRLQRETEYAVILVCNSRGLCEQFILRRIIDLLRIPFVASYKSMHYCELCDATFDDSELKKHLTQTLHVATAASVKRGAMCLVSHEAKKLAVTLQERPTISLSRFRAGLGITDRFCNCGDAERAKQLHRVRDLDVPAKLLREVLPEDRQQAMWVTPDELFLLEDEYRLRSRKGSRRIR